MELIRELRRLGWEVVPSPDGRSVCLVDQRPGEEREVDPPQALVEPLVADPGAAYAALGEEMRLATVELIGRLDEVCRRAGFTVPLERLRPLDAALTAVCREYLGTGSRTRLDALAAHAAYERAYCKELALEGRARSSRGIP